MTCIICPRGCTLSVEVEGDRVVSVTGNTCKRGETYARTEITDPRRTLTSTVRLSGATADRFLPVKTDSAIPKGKMMEVMAFLKTVTVTVPVSRGDVLVQDICGTGASLVACKTIEK